MHRKTKKFILILFKISTHLLFLIIGLCLGMYILPIITASPKPNSTLINLALENSKYETVFVRDLPGSSFLYWGQGQLSLSEKNIVFQGKLSPGPSYKFYLTKKFVQDKESFLKNKTNAILIGDINSFNGFILKISPSINIDNYNYAVVWCESFSQFITSARYQQ